MDRTDEQDFDDWLASQKRDFDAAMRDGVNSAAVLQAVTCPDRRIRRPQGLRRQAGRSDALAILSP